MQLDDKISELLYHYDCVIIPEFGGFVTNYKPAHMDERLHLFHPPSKEVSFNKNLTRNDGLLANYLTQATDCSFEQANEVIHKSVEDYFSKLNNGERVVFKKVGIIYRDSNKNIRFQPSHEANFLKDAFGLEKLFALPVEKPVQTAEPSTDQKRRTESAPVIPMEVKSDDEVTRETKRAEEPVHTRRRIIWAAAVAIPVMLYSGWLISTADISKPAGLTIADLNPFKGKPAAVYHERESVTSLDIEPSPSEDDFSEALNSDAAAIKISFTDTDEQGVWVRLKEVTVTPPVSTYTATPEVLAMRYHIVAGCFSELSNARRMVDNLRSRGYKAYIYDYHKGLYRVTFADFHQRQKALQALRIIKQEEMRAAWLLVQ